MHRRHRGDGGARLIQTLGEAAPHHPHRLWDAEEEGLLGSLAYVKQHFERLRTPSRSTPNWWPTSTSMRNRARARRQCLRTARSRGGGARGAGPFEDMA